MISTLVDTVNDVNEIETRDTLEKAVAFILSEGGSNYRETMDKYMPGSSQTILGHVFESPFREFKTNMSGILRSIGSTSVSWMGGKINDSFVIFVHPTSNTVNYNEVIDCLKSIKDIPVIETDQNFISNIRSSIPHIFKEIV